MQFSSTVLTEHQEVVFKFTDKSKVEGKPGRDVQLKLVVKSLEGAVIGHKITPVGLLRGVLILVCFPDREWSVESKCVRRVRQERGICDKLCRVV